MGSAGPPGVPAPAGRLYATHLVSQLTEPPERTWVVPQQRQPLMEAIEDDNNEVEDYQHNPRHSSIASMMMEVEEEEDNSEHIPRPDYPPPLHLDQTQRIGNRFA